MKRGEIWTVAGGGGYAGKPRPAVIVQANEFEHTASITVVLFTSNEADAPLYRILVEPSVDNGLAMASRMMADKTMTLPREQLGDRIGKLGNTDVIRLNRAIIVFLGLAGSD